MLVIQEVLLDKTKKFFKFTKIKILNNTNITSLTDTVYTEHNNPVVINKKVYTKHKSPVLCERKSWVRKEVVRGGELVQPVPGYSETYINPNQENSLSRDN